jgi:hypothetical protein
MIFEDVTLLDLDLDGQESNREWPQVEFIF